MKTLHNNNNKIYSKPCSVTTKKKELTISELFIFIISLISTEHCLLNVINSQQEEINKLKVEINELKDEQK